MSSSSNASDPSYPLRDCKNTSAVTQPIDALVKSRHATRKTPAAKKPARTAVKSCKKGKKNASMKEDTSDEYHSMNFSEFDKYSLIMESSPDGEIAATASPLIETHSTEKHSAPLSAFTSTPHDSRIGLSVGKSRPSRPTLQHIPDIHAEPKCDDDTKDEISNCASRLDSIHMGDVSSIAELHSPQYLSFNNNQDISLPSRIMEISDCSKSLGSFITSPDGDKQLEHNRVDRAHQLMTPCTRAANNSHYVTGRRTMSLRSHARKGVGTDKIRSNLDEGVDESYLGACRVRLERLKIVEEQQVDKYLGGLYTYTVQ